jgi:diadenosine tetraphosphate (Ap4A) HIT family hydrolase
VTTEHLYYLPHARSPEQVQEMTALEAAGVCIFCPSSYTYREEPAELLPDGQSFKKRVLEETQHWTLLHNEYPYPGSEHHYLMVPKQHVTSMTDLSPAARADWWNLLDIVNSWHGDHYALGIRSGDMAYNGGTIAHLHIHFVIAQRQPPVKVRFRMSGNPPP